MITPYKYGFGTAIANGKQFMPWIHISDLCELFITAIENKDMQGVFNAVSPEHITNKEFSISLAHRLKKQIWLPNIPKIIIQLLLGKMSVIITNGSRVSSKKILDQGFNFKYLS